MKKSGFSKSLVVFAQLAVLFLAAAAHGDVCYYVTDTSPCRGYALNDSAQIVGYTDSGIGLWQSGSVTELGMLPGYAQTGAEGISESGRYVAGYAFNGVVLDGRGVLWTDGIIAELPPLPGDASASALKVNDAGIAVGSSALPGILYPDGMRPVYWENGVPYELPTLGGAYGEALDINNAGTIVGDAQREDGTWGTTLWVNGVPVDVGGLPGYGGSWSRAINDAGQAAVNSSGPAGGGHQFRAALWDNGVFTEVQELPGRPNTYSYGVNALEEIVGWSFVEYIGGANTGTFVDPVAFVWRDGVTYDLNSLIPADSGLDLRWARDINDRGQIVGRGYRDGQRGGYLLTPVPILTPELSGGGTADVVYDRYGNVGAYAAGLPGSSELVGGSTDLNNLQLTGAFATLMLRYDEDDLLYRSVAEESLRLYWYNDLLSQWVLAGNNANLTWNPAAQFVLGAPTDVLGDWGLNMADDYIWANIDHASTYSMGGQANVPAPGAMLLGILGIGVAAATRRIRRK